MKLKVVDNYRKVVVVEADTIDTLKARIMECFSLSEEDLSQRLLVPDDRDMRATLPFCTPMVGGFDLLQLEEGSILEDILPKDCLYDGGDRLLLGWKGPFIISFASSSHREYASVISLVSSAHQYVSLNIEVDPYLTLGMLKKLIMWETGEPVTVENLPRILFWGDDNKPLIYFGLYKYYRRGGSGSGDREMMVKLRINRNRKNMPDLRYMEKPFWNLTIFRTEPATPLYFGEKYDAEEELKGLKVLDHMDNALLLLTDVLIVSRNKTQLSRVEKEPPGCFYSQYYPSKKRWTKIMNIIKERKMKRKREPGYREAVEEEEEEEEHPLLKDPIVFKRKIARGPPF